MRNTWLRLATSLTIAVALMLTAWPAITAGVMGGANLRLADALFQGDKADPRILVVAIDDKSLERYGRWPWDRKLHASLIDKMVAGGVLRIGYDILFTEQSNASSDQVLSAAVRRAGNVVLAAAAEFEKRPSDILRAGSYTPPLDLIGRGALAVAHANVFPDDDGVVRALPAVIEDADGELVPAFSVALVEPSAAREPMTVLKDGVIAGGRLIRTGEAHLLDVNFVGETTIPIVSAADVLDGRISAERLRGKIVLVGVTAVALGDQKLTPINKSEGQPGVVVHANAANTIASSTYLIPESLKETLLWVFLLALMTALAMAFLRVWLSPVVAISLGAGYTFFAFARFDSGRVANLVYPPGSIVLSYMAALAVRYFTEFRERRRVTQVFARYVARDVVDEVLASPEGAVATLAGASRPMSILFADLRGFTSASERSSPQEVVAALNVYLDAMTEAVIQERGTVDKFMGDCVMAFWGAPRGEPEHASRAARAALRMLENIDTALRDRPEAALLKVKGCGVGIATGEAVVGNIGSHLRLDYTVIGDTVNTASRLCGVAGPGEIVVSEGCRRVLGEDFRIGDMPALSVKGKADPLRVFQLLRPDQHARVVEAGEQMSSEEVKGTFATTPAAPVVPPQPSVAGYAPVEPAQDPTA